MIHTEHAGAWQRRRWTLQFRLAMGTGVLVVICSFMLVMFINVTVAVISDRAIDNAPLATPATDREFSGSTPVLNSACTVPVSLSPPSIAPVTTQSARGSIQSLLRDVQLISLIGFVFIGFLGSAISYVVAGIALRPLRQIGQKVQQISAGTLNNRIVPDGPYDEIYDLASAFNTMLDRLEQAFERQSEFVANVAHELRTPLATLRTSIEVMQSDAQATLDEYRAIMATLERSLIRLEKVVDNLLILASHSEGIIAGETIELCPLIEDVLFDLHPIADAQHVTVRLLGDAETATKGELTLLSLVFKNLIENAIHYNRPGGEVTVTLSQDTDWAIIDVTDTGIGIADEEQARLFERFYRGDRSRSRYSRGTGLGLSVVAHIVQKHGGQIKMESTPESGTRVTVWLPRSV